MIEWREYSAKTVEEAVSAAEAELGIKLDESQYEIIEKESTGFLGLFGNRSAKIKVKHEVKQDVTVVAKEFLTNVFNAMEIEAVIEAKFVEETETVEIEVEGKDMGILIGKRGQTLDSLQYLVSLVINKESEGYIKVKLDTENYRERRKETLENLASNIAVKVKKTHKVVSLEPMNPYERRIIHSTLQNDKFVDTHSEGDEPYRKVVVTPKKGLREYSGNSNNSRYNKKTYDKKPRTGNYGNKINNPKEFQKKYGADTKDYSTDYKKDYAAYLESKAAAKAAADDQEQK